jgi:rsbT co-antagonist protein RsbR
MATRLPEILRKHSSTILADWLTELKTSLGRKLVDDKELEQQGTTFLHSLDEALSKAPDPAAVDSPAFAAVRENLSSLSRDRGLAGFTPAETALFVFSLKRPLFTRISQETPPNELSGEVWNATLLLDKLGLFTLEAYQKTREEVIARQQQDMLELSTPVVKLWDGILALPMIGTLDSERTQVVMETLLQRIVETGSSVAILDITGVPTVDTLVAQHLLKTVAAARLMGADCIISGIRPQIAQTIVHLGVDLGAVVTKASLADAFGLALRNMGKAVVKTGLASTKLSDELHSQKAKAKD